MNGCNFCICVQQYYSMFCIVKDWVLGVSDDLCFSADLLTALMSH